MAKRVVKAMFPNIEDLKADDLVKSQILKNLLKEEVPKTIELAHKSKKLYACVFEINNSGQYIEIHKKDWITALETCVFFYVQQEEYEKCTEINKLIESIRDSQKKPKIKI